MRRMSVLKCDAVGAPAGGPSSSSRAHGRRCTNTYPPTPNTTAGITISIPNTVLIIVFSNPSVVALHRRFLIRGGPEPMTTLAARARVTIAQRVIFKAGPVYT